MEKLPDWLSGWRPVDTAPRDEEVELLVADRRGEPYVIPYPCKMTAASGWVSAGKGTPIGLTPSQWRQYNPSRK
jgi:hypothetical protein